MKIGGFVGRVLDETGKCMIKHKQQYDTKYFLNIHYVHCQLGMAPDIFPLITRCGKP